jgi:NlpC/P60 family
VDSHNLATPADMQQLLDRISRRQVFRLWCVAWFLLVVILIQPLGYSLERLATILLILVVWAGSFYLGWQRLPVRIGVLVITFSAILYLILPGRSVDARSLRAEYVHAMQGYIGTPYVWGGENHVGIDCSGLVREGLIQANFRAGITTLNPSLVRQGLAMWWFDLSALALRNGERGWTTRLFQADSINSIDPAQLLPGDLAATADGVHILAYIGDKKWIEADPGERKTIVVAIPARINYWFGVPVYILRWQQLVD